MAKGYKRFREMINQLEADGWFEREYCLSSTCQTGYVLMEKGRLRITLELVRKEDAHPVRPWEPFDDLEDD